MERKSLYVYFTIVYWCYYSHLQARGFGGGADPTTTHHQVLLSRVLYVRFRVTPKPPQLGEVSFIMWQALAGAAHTPPPHMSTKKRLDTIRWKALLTRGFQQKNINPSLTPLVDDLP